MHDESENYDNELVVPPKIDDSEADEIEEHEAINASHHRPVQRNTPEDNESTWSDTTTDTTVKAKINIAIGKHLLKIPQKNVSDQSTSIDPEEMDNIDQQFKETFNIPNNPQGEEIIMALNRSYRLLEDPGQNSVDGSNSEAQKAFLDQLTALSKSKQSITIADISLAFSKATTTAQDAQFEAQQKTEHHTTLNWWKRTFSRGFKETITQALHSNPDARQDLINQLKSWRENGNNGNEKDIQAIEATALQEISKEYDAIDQNPKLDKESKDRAQRVLLKNALKLIQVFNRDASNVDIDENGNVEVTSRNTSTKYNPLSGKVENWLLKIQQESNTNIKGRLNQNLSESLSRNNKVARALYKAYSSLAKNGQDMFIENLNKKTTGPLTEDAINNALQEVKESKEYTDSESYKIQQFKKQQQLQWKTGKSWQQHILDAVGSDVPAVDFKQILLGNDKPARELKRYLTDINHPKNQPSSSAMKAISDEFNAIINDKTTSVEYKAIAKTVFLQNALKLVKIYIPDAQSVEINGKNNIEVIRTNNQPTLTYDRSLGWETTTFGKNSPAQRLDRFFSRGYGKTIEQAWNNNSNAFEELELVAAEIKQTKNTTKQAQIIATIQTMAQEEYDNIEPKTEKAIDAFKEKVRKTALLFYDNPTNVKSDPHAAELFSKNPIKVSIDSKGMVSITEMSDDENFDPNMDI